MTRTATAFAAAIATVAALAATGTASAGYVMTTQVVAASGSYAYGSMRDARDSADATQYIGCDVGTPASGSPYVSCYAYSSSYQYAYCYSYDADMVEAGRSVSPGDYLYFTVGSGSLCSNITVRTASYDL